MQSQLKILFVDDHSGLRDGISFLLSKENANLQFYNASTKEDALEILRNNSDIKNAILDININGESGLNFIDDFRMLVPQLNIIIYTMYSDMLHIEAAIKKNIQGYITKDCEVREIEKAIEFVSGGSMYYNKAAKEVMQSMLFKNNNPKADYEELRVQELFENYKTFTPKEQEVFVQPFLNLAVHNNRLHFNGIVLKETDNFKSAYGSSVLVLLADWFPQFFNFKRASLGCNLFLRAIFSLVSI